MNVMFAGLSVIMLVVLIFAKDHFVEEHLWNHIIKKHLPTIFAWTFGASLKKTYEPDNNAEDADIERIARLVEAGQL